MELIERAVGWKVLATPVLLDGTVSCFLKTSRERKDVDFLGEIGRHNYDEVKGMSKSKLSCSMQKAGD